MIRRLFESDREQALSFVGGQPAENLFIIGDIVAYGFDDPIQTLWGDFREDGTMRGILLRYTNNYIAWAPGEFDAKGMAGIFNADRSTRFLSGIETVVRKVEPHLNAKPANPRVLYYAKCETAEALPDVPPEQIVRKAVPGDAAALIDQMYAIPEFADGDYSVEHKRRTLTDGTARAYLIERDGRIISSASSTAENPLSAMIVGVGTVPGYEKQGLAGSIYKRIGFKDIGKWCMWTFETERSDA